jgi:hypothetical protein
VRPAERRRRRRGVIPRVVPRVDPRVAAITLIVAVACAALVVAPGASWAQQPADDLTPADARRLARDVLGKGPPVTLPDTTLPEFGDPPEFRLPEPGGDGGGIGTLGWVVLGLLAAVVVAGVVWAIRAVVRDRRRDDADDDESDPAVTTGRRGRVRAAPGSADDLARRAQEAADAGDFRGALRLLHRAGLAFLEEDRVLRLRRGRTNADYARIVASLDPDAARGFATVTVDTESAHFGGRDADEAAWHRAVATWRALRGDLSPHHGAASADRSRDPADDDVDVPT